MRKYSELLTLSFALVLFIELDIHAATLPFAKGEHPRIIITKDEIPLIAAKVDELTDPLYPRYMAMKRDVDAAISNNWNWEFIKGPSSGDAQVRAVSAAFVYLIENYLHPDSSSFYVNGVKQVLENTNPNSWTGYARQLKSFAVAYDWIYNGLSPQERITIGNKLMTSYAIQEDPNNRGPEKWPLDDWHTMMSNMPSGEWTYAAIAIWNETDLNGNAGNSLAQDRLNQIRTFLTTKKIPFTNMVGGGINPDGGYDDIGGTRQFALELYAWDRATGENLWNRSGYLQANVSTRLFAWRMYTDCWLPYGMFYDEDRAFSEQYPIEILSKKDTTGIAQYAANNLFKKGIQVDWYANWEQYRWIIFYDPAKPATNYNTLPLAYYAQGYNADGTTPIEGLDAGWVFFRSGWSKDDTLIAFTSGDWFTAKQVYDVNAFSIYRSGDLAIMNKQNQWTGGEDSVTGDGHNYSFQMNYGKPTVAVNSITISDPNIAMDQGQELFQYGSVHPDNVHPNYVYYDQPANPEHGDYVNEAINTVLASHSQGAKYFDRGDIKKFETKNSYDYALGDGSKAYHPDRLTNFQRALTFLDKKYLVILDRVSSAKPSFVKRWYLHTVKEPAIPGASLTDTSSQDGSTTWSQADFNNLHIDSDIATFPGGGRLFVKSLMPQGATYRKRGGEGFFFWRNDRSWNPEPGSPADKSDSLFEGRKGWRLEQDTSGQKDDIFLNVLFPTDAAVTSMAETELVSSANMIGAHIKDPAKNYIALFSSDPQGIAQNNVTYSLNDEPSVLSQHFLFDLTQGTYDVYKDEVRIFSNLVPSEEGVLTFESTAGSTFTVIQGDTATINHPPSADFTASPLNGESPLTVNFIDSSTNNPTSWLWDFGDNVTSANQNPTHTYNTAGSYTVSLTASNQSGSNTKTIPNLITVTAPDTTLPIVFITEPLDNSTVKDTIIIKASASDNKEVNRVEFYINHTFRSADNTLPYEYSWDTTTVSDGPHSIKAKAYDDAGTSKEAGIKVTVSNVIPNHPPVLDPIGNKTSNEGQLLTFTISATDPNNDGLTYSAANLPTGAIFNPGTRTFSWTPNFNQSGSYYPVFKVEDNSKAADYQTVVIEVKDEPQPISFSLKINKDALYTLSRQVSLILGYSDNLNLTKMRFSKNGKRWSTWKAISHSYAYTLKRLPAGVNCQMRTVYVRFKDNTGKVYGSDLSIFDSIQLKRQEVSVCQ